MLKYFFMGLACVSSLFVASQASAAIVDFDLRGNAGFGLLPGNEIPGAVQAVTGGEVLAGIQFDTVTKILNIRVGWGIGSGFTGSLSGDATVAHIHRSSGIGANGPVIINIDRLPFFFNRAAAAGTIFGDVALSLSQEVQLMNGELYINVHTAANPGGEIRGNIVAVPEPSSMALVGLALVGLGAWKRRKKKQA